MPSDPHILQTVAWIVVALFAILGALNQGAKFLQHLKDKPPPGDVLDYVKTTYVTLDDFSDLADSVKNSTSKTEMATHVARAREDHAAIWTKMDATAKEFAGRLDDIFEKMRAELHREVEKIGKQGDEGRLRIHQRLTPLESSVAGLDVKIQSVKENVAGLDKKLDHTNDRITEVLAAVSRHAGRLEA